MSPEALWFLLALPAMTFVFVWGLNRNRARLEELRLRKQILELEIRKQDSSAALLLAENARQDRLLSSSIHEAVSARREG